MIDNDENSSCHANYQSSSSSPNRPPPLISMSLSSGTSSSGSGSGSSGTSSRNRNELVESSLDQLLHVLSLKVGKELLNLFVLSLSANSLQNRLNVFSLENECSLSVATAGFSFPPIISIK